jgi:hypothetical protein
LEVRNLLSSATPTFVLRHPFGGAAPFGSPGPTGYTPTQVRQAYGFNQISLGGGAAADGSGTTIAIVDAYDDPNAASDLHQFDVAFGLPDPVFTKVNQSGGSTPPTASTGWAQEIALDVEWAHAIAPKANILLVEASSASYTNLFAAVKYAARQPGVVAVSMSWGGGEFTGESSYDSTFVTPTGHAGVAFVASSGDSGAPVSYPAVSPNVLAVGGTTLNLTSSNAISTESGWSGSGGGISALEAQPAYQKGVVTQSGTARANPDVAYDADPNTGFPVYLTYGNSASAPWLQFGGTSDAAPQWAALVAIADQGRALVGEAALDGPPQLLPMLYQLPSSDFHDVTSGSSTGSPSYSAGPGYDLVTGRGTPVANLVVAGLIGSPTINPSVTHFQVSAPAAATAGAPFSVTVTALDANNNVVTDYAGTLHFSSSDGQAALPANYAFTTLDAGAHTFAVTLKTAGTQTVTVADVAAGSVTGSASVSVGAASGTVLSVSGFSPVPVTAGSVGSFTLKAQDPYGNLLPGYSGTVHFTSTDPHAVLPGDATLTNGTGTFSATFVTAGTQSLSATDTVTATITGTETGILVNPAAPASLAFGQQPTNAAAGAAISPAVTVRLFDAYGNLATNDGTDSVTIALGANPGGATLSGTTTVKVSGGVATFANLSLNQPGTGYTLAASSPALTTGATSAAFNVTAAPSSTVIEGFEAGSTYYLAGSNYARAYRSTAAAHDGTYGLEDTPDGDWYYRNDSAVQVTPGETISVWVRFAGAADGRAYFGFGASSGGTLSLVAAPNTGQLLLQDNSGFGFTQLAAVSQAYQANHWYRLEVVWGSGGALTGHLYDGNGTTLLNTVTAADTAFTSGGIAFRATGSYDKQFDTVTRSQTAGPSLMANAAPVAAPAAPKTARPSAARRGAAGVGPDGVVNEAAYSRSVPRLDLFFAAGVGAGHRPAGNGLDWLFAVL